jgi:peptidoglycan/LPS O-acetylase OafA/YrhL
MTRNKHDVRLIEVDALRGLASMAVVLYHLTYLRDEQRMAPFTVGYGHYGVELFFIISGFVIFMSLANAGSLRDFVASRIARLYPAYWAAALVTTAVAFVMESHPPSGTVIASNLSMIEAFFGTPYLDWSYWTLSIEIEFYVAIGIVFAVGLLGRIESICLGALIVMMIIRLALLYEIVPPITWFDDSVAAYPGFFVIGICLYRLRERRRSEMTVWVLAFAILNSAWGGGYHALSPGPLEYLAVTCGLTIVMWLAVNGHARMLRAKPLLFLGGISYPLYLLHHRIGVDLMEAFHRHGFPGWAAIALAILAAMGLATLIHVSVETPARPILRKILTGTATRPRHAPS